MTRRTLRFPVVSLLLGLSMLAIFNQAQAVPSFARQMNMECSGCHTRFPKLNAFGREFKLSGYTMAAGKQIQGVDGNQKETLSVNELPPLSVMLETAYTNTGKSVPDAQNSDVELPQQLSLFLAGRISPKIGSFVQMTYTQQDDKLTMDNADLRYADRGSVGGKSLTYGITLNNSPTVEDLWNSTPTWGFPFSGPDSAPAPVAATLIDGGLSQDVAGIGGYLMLDQSWYAAASLYRSAHLGSNAPTSSSTNTLSSAAPYLRMAWQHQWGANYLEIGAYGMWSKLMPDGIHGEYDKYKDIAADFQYERTLNKGQLTVHGTVIRETQNLDATFAANNSSNASNKLHTARMDASYGLKNWEWTGGLFSTTGDRDEIRYAPTSVDGSATGKPDNSGWLCQVSYSPWQNVQVMAQYTGYAKFNGSRSNYDGAGRNASDNNTLFLQAWFVW